MKNRYRIYCRENGTFYSFDTISKKRDSLETKDRDEAIRLVNAQNEALQAARNQSPDRTGLFAA